VKDNTYLSNMQYKWQVLAHDPFASRGYQTPHLIDLGACIPPYTSMTIDAGSISITGSLTYSRFRDTHQDAYWTCFVLFTHRCGGVKTRF